MWRFRLVPIVALLSMVAVLSVGCSKDRKPVAAENQPPRIASLEAEPESVLVSGVSRLTCAANDPDGDELQYQWSATAGILSAQGAAASWTAPAVPGAPLVRVRVSDGHGGETSDSIRISVLPVPNAAPVVVRMAVDPPVAASGDTVRVTCVATDDDGDPLEYAWGAEAGSFDGEGAAVGWIAPAADGIYRLWVRVTDDRGGEARDTTSVDVFDGALLVKTRDGLAAVRLDGAHWVLQPESNGSVEVLGDRIFSQSGRGYAELDLQGNEIHSVSSDNPAVQGQGFVMLPDTGFVFLDNAGDQMFFHAPNGSFRQAVPMPGAAGGGLQNVTGVISGGRLILSENGNNDLIAVDLVSLEPSIFRPVSEEDGWLGAIDWVPDEETYYLCRRVKVQQFSGAGEVRDLVTLPVGSASAVVAVGSYVYVGVNTEGTVRRIHRATGEMVVLAAEFNYPEDLEYLPVRLTPP